MFYRTWTVLRVAALGGDSTSGTVSAAVLGSGISARALSLLCSSATCHRACAITTPSRPRSVNYRWNRYIGISLSVQENIGIIYIDVLFIWRM